MSAGVTSKANKPIDVTDAGITSSSKAVDVKAPSPIEVTVDGILTEVMD